MSYFSGDRIREWSAWAIIAVLVVLAGMGSGLERVLSLTVAAVLLLLKSDFYCLDRLLSSIGDRFSCLEQRFSAEQESIENRFASIIEQVEELKRAVERAADNPQPVLQPVRARQQLWMAAVASTVIAANAALFVYVQSEVRVLRGEFKKEQIESLAVEPMAELSSSSRNLTIGQFDSLAQRFAEQDKDVVLADDSFAISELWGASKYSRIMQADL